MREYNGCGRQAYKVCGLYTITKVVQYVVPRKDLYQGCDLETWYTREDNLRQRQALYFELLATAVLEPLNRDNHVHGILPAV